MKKNLLLCCCCLPVHLLYAQYLVPYCAGKKWGYADENGRLVLPAQYDSVEDYKPFNTALRLYKNGKTGFVSNNQTDKVDGFQTAEPQFDSVQLLDFSIKVHLNGLTGIYSNRGFLLLPLNMKNKGEAMLKMNWAERSKSYPEKAEKYARPGEPLIFSEKHYYRIIEQDATNKDTLQPVILDADLKKKLQQQKNNKGVLRRAHVFNLPAEWYSGIDIYPNFRRERFVPDDKSLTAFDSSWFPPVWVNNYQHFEPAANTVIKKLTQVYPDYGLLQQNGKLALMSASYTYRSGERPHYFTVHSLPVFDSLLYIQEGERWSTTHIPSFYFKKQDSICVLTGGSMSMLPILAGPQTDIKYIHNGFYLLHNNNRQTLFYKGAAFITEGRLVYIDAVNGIIAVQMPEGLQLYEAFDGKTIWFEKQLAVAGAGLYAMQYKRQHMEDAVLMAKLQDGTTQWYKKESFTAPWQPLFTAKLLLEFYGLYKVEQEGKIFYINSNGLKFCTE